MFDGFVNKFRSMFGGYCVIQFRYRLKSNEYVLFTRIETTPSCALDNSIAIQSQIHTHVLCPHHTKSHDNNTNFARYDTFPIHICREPHPSMCYFRPYFCLNRSYLCKYAKIRPTTGQFQGTTPLNHAKTGADVHRMSSSNIIGYLHS